MRITQLGKFYPPENGGIETVTLDLAEGFVRQGWTSEAIVFTRRQPENITLNGVSLLRVKCQALLASQPLGLGWIITAIRRARLADASILHAPNLLGGIVSPFLGRGKLVVLWHSDIVNKGIFGIVAWPLEEAMLRRADQIWVTSDIYAASSRRLRRHVNKIHTLAIGIRDAATGPLQPLSPEILEFLRGRRFALSVGRLVPYKGFQDLIEAAALLDDDQAIVIAGTGPLETELASAINKHGLSDRVLLAGRVPDDLLKALFAHAALFVLASNQRSEAYGVVLLEAMTFGLPIVTTDIQGSGVPWVAGEGATGPIVPVGSPTALAAAIQSVMADNDTRALRQRSRERFVDLFGVQTMVERACALLR